MPFEPNTTQKNKEWREFVENIANEILMGNTKLVKISVAMYNSLTAYATSDEEITTSYGRIYPNDSKRLKSIGNQKTKIFNQFKKFITDNRELNTRLQVECPDSYNKLFLERGKNKTEGLFRILQFIRKEEITISKKRNRADIPAKEYYGLPNFDKEFIGREKDLQKLYEYISYDFTSPIVVVEGIGGVGKTTLVAEAAYRCLEYKHGHRKEQNPLPFYDVVVFVDFKQEELRPYGIVKKDDFSVNLNCIFHALRVAFNDESILRFSSGSISEQTKYVKERLHIIDKKILLIIDDFQSIDDVEREKVLAFLINLPRKVKTVITTRKGSLGPYSNIKLEELEENEAIQLINQCLKDSVPNVHITQEEKEAIIGCYRRLPLAITYSVGQIANGYSVKDVLGASCPKNKDTIAKFCFDRSIQALKSENSRLVLEAISLFDYAPLKQAVVKVSELDENELAADAFAEVKRCVLAQPDSNDRYLMNSITRDYVLNLLKKDKEKYRHMINLRYAYHFEFAKEYGGNDLGAWWVSYRNIRHEWKNLISELEYCIANEQYDKSKELWNLLNHFADLSGFWTERLHFLTWIIDRAKLEEDDETYIRSIFRKIWTLTMQSTEDSYKQAEDLLEEGESLLENKKCSPALKDYAFHNSIVLLTRRKQYDRARKMLIKKNEALDELSKDSNLKAGSVSVQKCYINSLRDEAKIDLKQGKLQEAKEKYLAVKNMSAEINWKRIECYAKNELADICITQNQFLEAEEYLLSGIQTAINNRNNRRYACYQKSFAKLYSKQGRISDSYKAASLAGAMFKKLGMISELDDMTNFYQLQVEDISYANLPKEFEVQGE